MTTTAHSRALDFMVKHLGEHEIPPGSNTGPFVRYCQAATWLRGTRWPWCVAAWVRAWTDAGYKLPYLGAGAYEMLAWYQQHLPGWVVPVVRAKPGAAVILNEGAGHCAMLVSYDPKNRVVHTIAGNESDMVKESTYPVSMIRGVVDPPEVGPPPPVVAKKPVFEVVTSASGHKVVYVSGVKAISNKLPQILRRYKSVAIRPRPPK